MDEPFDWFAEVHGPRDAPNGITLYRKLTEPTSVRIITLKLWRSGGRMPYVIQRPMFGSQLTELPFPPLARDHYEFAVFDAGHSVFGGRFAVPLKGPEARSALYIRPRDAPFCLRIQENPQQFLYGAARKEFNARRASRSGSGRRR
jgi:hypothetical protein